jgi:hypothetical protein
MAILVDDVGKIRYEPIIRINLLLSETLILEVEINHPPHELTLSLLMSLIDLLARLL